jgi:hypothetical protein
MPLLDFLAQSNPLAHEVHVRLTEDGRFPSRRTWERCFKKLPALIGCLGSLVGWALATVDDAGASRCA